MAFNQPPRDAGAEPLLAAVRELVAAKAQLTAEATRLEGLAREMAAQRGRGAATGEGALGARATAGEDAFAAVRGSRNIASATTDLQRLGQVQAVASAQMQRHGALTTEFLAGLARGEVTLADFGYHISGTIGKFAGWTAAAGAVYGVLGAVKELGSGARDASSGTDQLQRFITKVDESKAQQGFRDVSKELNVPIKDVSTAQAQFARIFKDQDQSLAAARISLLATKLDNVDTANSYRFLTGIVQEFQVPASRLPLLFDQISAAQRRAGGKVSELLPAIARSSAAVRNAGGDLTQLIALANTAQVASGQTGQSVGTAFYRAPRFVAKNAAQLKEQFGLDPNEGFTQFLIDATKKAQEIQPKMRRILAELIGGPQLGSRIFQPLLNRKDLLDKSLGVTDPAHAQGSAQEELRHKLAQVDEQISAIGNNLQRLGSALVQSGAFVSLGLLLHVLNESLGAVTKLVEVFDRLPAPIRDALVLMVELRGAMALARGTLLGASVAGRIPLVGGLIARPIDEARLNAVSGLRNTETALGASSVGASAAAQGAAGGAAAQREILAQQEAQIAAARAGNGTLEEIAVMQRETVAIKNRIQSFEEEQLKQETLAQGYMDARAGVVEKRVALQNRENAAMAELTAGMETSATEQAAQTATTEERVGQQVAQDAAGANALTKGKKAMGKGLGLLNAALIGFLAGTELQDLIKQSGDHIEQVAKRLSDQALSTRDLAAHQKDAQNQGKPQDVLDRSADLLSGIGDVAGLPLGSIGKAYNQFTGRDVLQQAGAAAATADKTQRKALRDSLHSTVQIVDDNLNDLGVRLKQDIDALHSGHITRAEYARRFAVLQRSANSSLEAGAGQADVVKEFKHQQELTYAHALSPTKADPFAQFSGDAAPSDTLSLLQRNVDVAGVEGRAPNLQLLARGFVAATEKYHHAQSAKNLKDLQTAQGLYVDAVTKDAQDTLKNTLASTEDPERRRQAYQTAINKVAQGRAKLYSALAEGRQGLDAAQKRLHELEGERGIPQGDAGRERAGGDARPGLSTDQKIKATEERIRKLRSAYNAANGAVSKKEAELADLLRQLKEQEFSDYSANVDVQAAYAESQTTDKVEQIKLAIQADDQLVAEAIKLFGAHSKEALAAITKSNNDRVRLVDEQRARLVTSNQLETSQIQTQGAAGDHARAQSALAGLYRVLAYDRAHNADIQVIQQDMISINDARRSLAQQALKDAQDLYDSKVEAAIAATDDPIKAAKLKLGMDRHDLKGLRGADYYKQLAKVRTDEKGLRQAIVTEDMEQARFLYQTEQIGSDQYIAQLQNILKLKGLSKATRRQIMQEIYQVEHQDTGQLSLNVDNIRVPTIYEVRRALAQNSTSFAQTPIGVNQTNTLNIVMNGKEGVKELATTLDSLLHSSVEAGLRAAGAI